VAIQNLPIPSKGPYTIDLDDLFAQASRSVRVRGDVLAQLRSWHKPPDLETIIAEQREVITAGIREQFDRCSARAERLHDILARQVDPVRLDKLRASLYWAIGFENRR
jgi:hypothetical protein